MTAPIFQPILSTPAVQDQPFNLNIVNNFLDPDGDTMTYAYTATRADGTVIDLTSWLTLDSVTGIFSGQPAFGDVGDFTISVVATDTSGEASEANAFALAVSASSPTPDPTPAPTPDPTPTPLPDPTPAPTPDPTPAPLPDPTPAPLPDPTPTPLPDPTPTPTPDPTPTPTPDPTPAPTPDPTPAPTPDPTPTPTPDPTPAPINHDPVVTALADIAAIQGQSFTLSTATNFSDSDEDTLTYSATLENGDALPEWLSFDAATGTFDGTPTGNVTDLAVKVTANDGKGGSVNDVFALAVKSPIENKIDGIWNFNSPGNIKVSLASNKTDDLNEIGVFKLDADGKVNGFAPGEEGFIKALLEQGQVVFSTLPGSITEGLDLSRSFGVENGEKLGFFVIANGSVDDSLSGNDFKNVFTSVDALKPFTVTPGEQGAFTLDWKQGEGKNLSFNFNVDNTADPFSSVASRQGKKDGEIFDMTGMTGKVEATFTLKREAAFNNSVSFYRIDDAAGTVTSNGQQFRPGDAGYIEAALSNALAGGINLSAKNGETTSVTKTIDAEAMYAPILMSNVNGSNINGADIFTAFSMGNSDKADHVRLLGNNTFGFEDMVNGGDKDFNDIIVQATFKPA